MVQFCGCLFWFLLMVIPPPMSARTSTECLDDGKLLRPDYYAGACPGIEGIVFNGVQRAVSVDPRMAASLLRLHFHDCFVNGCDASVLLDDTPTFQGEKSAGPNKGSLRGFEVIDAIKRDVECVCPRTVSCADILAIAARDSVVLRGGPSWEVQLGRRDSLTASQASANSSIPAPTSNVQTLVSKFQAVGLTEQDMVTLSGAHTIGNARCATFNTRLVNQDPTIRPELLASLQKLCFRGFLSNETLAVLDLGTPMNFDNQYYRNLAAGEGLLNSDQVLYSSGGNTKRLVEAYMRNPQSFFDSFRISMLKMGSILPLTGKKGEIRLNCRRPNSA